MDDRGDYLTKNLVEQTYISKELIQKVAEAEILLVFAKPPPRFLSTLELHHPFFGISLSFKSASHCQDFDEEVDYFGK